MGCHQSKSRDTQSNVLKIVFLGKAGSGKSATVNTILGERKFESKAAAGSVTQKCQTVLGEWKGKKVLVVDTPGFFDTEEKVKTTCKKISQCVSTFPQGPHAIILVLQLNRFTEEEQKVFVMIKALFGESVTRHMIILFTRGDELENRRLSDFLSDAEVSLKNVVDECGGRCCAFNNRAEGTKKKAQVQELGTLIENMMGNNDFFSYEIYKDVEKRLKKMADNWDKILDAQLKNEIDLVEKEYANKTQEEKERKLKNIREKYAGMRNMKIEL